MSKILTALARAASEDVVAGGLHWRVRRITSADLMAAGHAVLFVVPLRDASGEEVSSDPEAQARGLRFMDAVVAAGVQQVSSDGVSWERCSVVLDRKAEEPLAGRLFIGSLPPGAVAPIATAILSLSTDGEAAKGRLLSFLGG